MSTNSVRVEEVFSRALEKKSPAEREKYLAEACQGEPELRQQVQSLLQAHEQAGDFLGQTVKLPAAGFTLEKSRTMIGRYKLLEKIGEGGFGVVYMAEQEEPVHRRVALKIIKLGMDTREVVARFEAERQALAMMDHPNIANVFDGGATNTGRPYFVMELVKGVPLTDYCDANKLSTRERLDLFMQVCQAVQHAHQKGVIHRDLKPSNILVTVKDDRPVPKVIDFGVAKATQARLTEKTLFTRLNQLIGTPAYMSPEQAGLGSLDVDTRSDIYSLGVLLYELLTGRTPFDTQQLLAAGYDAVMRTIREEEPPKPSTRLSTLAEEELSTVAARRGAEPAKLGRSVRGDLDWIVMKALEKDRTRRYESANGLAHDIQRHLTHEPVLARPASKLYRFQKLVRRNKLAFAAAGAVALALALGLTGSLWMFARERVAHHEAVAAEQKAELETYAADMQAASLALGNQNYVQVRQMLTKYLPRPGRPDLRGVEWRYLWQAAQSEFQQVFSYEGVLQNMAISPDQRQLLTIGRDRRLEIRDIAANQIKFTLVVPSLARGADISPANGLFAYVTTNGIYVRELQSQRAVTNFTGAGMPMLFTPNGRWLVGRHETNFIAWDTISWMPRLLAPTPPRESAKVAFSADSRWAAVIYGGSEELKRQPGFVTDLEHPGQVRLLSAPDVTRQILAQSLSFSPDGQWLAAGTSYGRIHIFHFQSARMVATWQAHPWGTMVYGLAFSPDSRTLASGGTEQVIRFWKVGTWQLAGERTGPETKLNELRYSSDGQWISACYEGGKVMRFSARQQPPRYRTLTLGGDEMLLGPSCQGDGLWTCHQDQASRELHFWDAASNAVTRTIALTNRPELAGLVVYPWTLRHGRWLCWLGTNTEMAVMDVEAPSKVRRITMPGKVHKYWTVSPDGKRLAGSFQTFSNNEQAAIWHLDSGRMDTLPAEYAVHAAFVHPAVGVSFSTDGRFLALRSQRGDSAVMIWDVAHGKRHINLPKHESLLSSIVFSPDGRLVATSQESGTVRLWDLASGNECLPPLKGAGWNAQSLQFSRDGKSLIGIIGNPGVNNAAKVLIVWHVKTHREMLRLASISMLNQTTILTGNDETLWWNEGAKNGINTVRATRLPTLAEIDAIEQVQPQKP